MIQCSPHKRRRVEILPPARASSIVFGVPDLCRYILSFSSLKDLTDVISKTSYYLRSRVLAINLVPDQRWRCPAARAYPPSTWLERRVGSELQINNIFSIVLFHLHVTDDLSLHTRACNLGIEAPLDESLWWECFSHLLTLLDMSPTANNRSSTLFFHHAMMAWAHGLGKKVSFTFLDKMCAQEGWDRHNMSFEERNEFRVGLYQTYTEELKECACIESPKKVSDFPHENRNWIRVNEATARPIAFLVVRYFCEKTCQMHMLSDPCTFALFAARKPEMTMTLVDMLFHVSDSDVILGRNDPELVESYKKTLEAVVILSMTHLPDAAQYMFNLWKRAVPFYDIHTDRIYRTLLLCLFCPSYIINRWTCVRWEKRASYYYFGYVCDWWDTRADRMTFNYVAMVEKGVEFLKQEGQNDLMDFVIRTLVRRVTTGLEDCKTKKLAKYSLEFAIRILRGKDCSRKVDFDFKEVDMYDDDVG